QAGPSVPRRVLVVAASIPRGSSHPDQDFGKRIEKETTDLVDTLARVAADFPPTAPVLWNPTGPELLANIANTNVPLWFIYVGHGQISSGRSAICLSDGDQPIEDIVKSLPAGMTASFWFNTCSSAVVDVLRFDTSVFSASTEPTSTKELGTPVGEALTRAIEDRTGASQPTDMNCDGIVTDAELFMAARPLLPAYGHKPPRPKLRRQGWAEIPLFAVRRLRSDCPTRISHDNIANLHPALSPVLERERRYRNGEAGSEGDTPPIVWVSKARAGQPLFGTSRPQFLISSVRDEDERMLAQATLLPRIWTISDEAGQLTVKDARDPGRSPIWVGPIGEIKSLLDTQGARN